MLIVLSPAKSLDLESPIKTRKFSQPEFLADAKKLVKGLKKLNPEELSELMNMSSKLGALNYERYASWQTPFDKQNARPAIFTFMGDVYQGLDADTFSAADLNYAQKHLRILSGLYGVLKPLDLMQPYRLEMGTRLANTKGDDLYAYWDKKLTVSLNQSLAEEKKKILVNLASKEYFKAVRDNDIDAEIITPVFRDYSNGKYRFLSYFAKQARGMMAAFIIKNRIDSVEKLRNFNTAGYQYSEQESTAAKPVFLRRQRP